MVAMFPTSQVIRPEDDPNWYVQRWGDRLTTEDNLLEFRLNGDLRAYAEIDEDPFLGRLIDERRESPFRKAWIVEPASQKPIDILAAELIRQWLKQIDFDDVCGKLNDAIFTGRSLAGLEDWQEQEFELKPKKNTVRRSAVVPRSVLAKDPSRLVFAFADYDPQYLYLNGFQARQLTVAHPFEGEPLPVNSIVLHSRGSLTGNPYGKGVYRRLYWLNIFKRQVQKIGIPALEAKALPYVTFDGTVSDADLNKAKEAVAQFYKLGWASIPDGIVLNFLERFHQGRIDSIKSFLDWYNSEAATAILGQTLTSKTQDNADRGNTQTHYQVGEDRAKSDADLLSSSLRHFLFEPIARLNFPNAKAPTVYRDFTPPPDLVAQSEVDLRLSQIGFKRSLDSVTELYGEGFEVYEPPAPVAAAPNPVEKKAAKK